jgi:DNA polymerase-3 subunit alpha
MPQPFIHLRARSAYSLLQSAIQVKSLAKLAAKFEMPALGLTDANNMFGALEFSEAAAELGIQPIVGVTLDVRGENGLSGTLALIAQNDAGYANLMQLSSAAYLESESHDDPNVPFARVLQHAEGLIALTGGGDGALAQLIIDGKHDVAIDTLKQLGAAFPNRLYVELQRHSELIEVESEGPLLDMAYSLGLPIVATNDIRFQKKTDHGAHDALMCIAASSYLGADDRPRVTHQHYFRPAEEMRELFSDLPEAIANTVEIARRTAFKVEKRKPILPRFDTKGGRDEAAELKAQAQSGLKARLKALGDLRAAPVEDYEKRLAFGHHADEVPGLLPDRLGLHQMGQGASGIPVGPGRGSGAGSLVAWALTITDLDPLRFGLLFERFLNPERVSMPDFDIDFCQDRRGEVIRYVQETLRRDRSRRSSPSVRCRRAPCCATSAACCRCRTARSINSPSWCRKIRPTRSRSHRPSRASRNLQEARSEEARGRAT